MATSIHISNTFILSQLTLIQLSELGCPWQYFVTLWVNFQSLVAHGNILLPFGSSFRVWLPMTIFCCPLGLGCLWLPAFEQIASHKFMQVEQLVKLTTYGCPGGVYGGVTSGCDTLK